MLAPFGRLQVPVAAEKVEGPSTQLVLLEIEMDTSRMCLRLPSKKLDNLRTMVADWLPKKSCLIRDLQSLMGKLQHASKVARPGRTFLHRSLSYSKGVRGTAVHLPQCSPQVGFNVVAHVSGVLEWSTALTGTAW